MTVDLNPFPDLNAPPAPALWPVPRADRDAKTDGNHDEAERHDGDGARPLSAWPRIFPGL